MSRIPTKLRVVLRDEMSYSIPWANKEVPCRAAFVTDADGNPNTFKRAKAWASQRSRYAAVQGSTEDPEIVEVENKPFKGLHLVGVEARGEGGKAWKVISPEGWLVDLREDVFMPLLFRKGLPRHLTIPATFLWAINHTQMRLVEAGSDLHKKILAQQKKTADPKPKRIPIKSLVVGGVFANFNEGGTYVYLGRVRHAGKLKFGWVFLSWDILGPDTHQEGFDNAFGALRFPVCIVTSSYSYTKQIGKVNVGDDPQTRIGVFRDGYGGPLSGVDWR